MDTRYFIFLFQSYGFKPEYWDSFGQALTESAREWEGWKTHRETIRAWTVLVSFIVDRMRQGYESASRKKTQEIENSVFTRETEENRGT